MNSYAQVEESILFEDVNVGRHARIRRAIVDKHVDIPPGTSIGYDLEEDRKRFHVTETRDRGHPQGHATRPEVISPAGLRLDSGAWPRSCPSPVALSLAAAELPSVPFERFTLENGLNVILSEDHSAPLVGVDVRYDVGSKDERPGRTGFAHLFEHLMFQGSQHLPKGEADRLIDNVGGSSNGGTSQDGTVYWQQVPSNALEQALFIESERMGWLLPTLDQEKLDNQREVVLNERRQSYEMQPYGMAGMTLLRQPLGPRLPLPLAPHRRPRGPARRHPGGRARVLPALVRAGQRLAGHRRRLRPGRGEAAGAEVVRRDPGRPPAGAPAAAPGAAHARGARHHRRRRWSCRASTWPGRPRRPSPTATRRSTWSPRCSRRGRAPGWCERMVMEERVAQSVMAGQSSQRLAGTFTIVATPKPGQSVERLLAIIDEELARLAREPPTAEELTRAVNKVESAAIFGLEPVGGFGGRAASLNHYWFEVGDPGAFARDIGRYRALSPDDVREAAARWLRKDARVVLTVKPQPPGEAPPVPPPDPSPPARPPTPPAPAPANATAMASAFRPGAATAGAFIGGAFTSSAAIAAAGEVR